MTYLIITYIYHNFKMVPVWDLCGPVPDLSLEGYTVIMEFFAWRILPFRA